MVSKYIYYQQHIMWYESDIIQECFDALAIAIDNSPLPVLVELCLNYQTYIEQPVNLEKYLDSFDIVQNHRIHETAMVVIINTQMNDSPFYNIGDWRRDKYDSKAAYTVWGETDCLIPEDYFYLLSVMPEDLPKCHLVTLSSRVMWDSTWLSVTHAKLRNHPFVDNQKPSHPELYPFRYYDYIALNELTEFNNNSPVLVEAQSSIKIDGSLLAISGNIDFQFIPDGLHFINEDTVAAMAFQLHGITQYCISTRLKGHNYYHPNKRTNTESKRNNETYLKYAEESRLSVEPFINQIINDRNRREEGI